jgi:hypothetical protein
MLPSQSLDPATLFRPWPAESLAREFEMLAIEMQIMLERIRVCWREGGSSARHTGKLAATSADIARSPGLMSGPDSLEPSLEQLRANIGQVLVTAHNQRATN